MSKNRVKIKAHLKFKEIDKRYKACEDAREKSHWHVIWLLSKPDNPRKAEEVAEIIGYSEDWVRKIVRRYNQEGAEGLKDKREGSCGRKPILTNEQQIDLYQKILTKRPSDGGLWTGPKIAFWINSNCGIKTSKVTGWTYLKKLGFVMRRPRPKNKDSATEEEMKEFKKNFKSRSSK